MKKLLLLLTGVAMVSSIAFAGMTPALTLQKTTQIVTPDGAWRSCRRIP